MITANEARKLSGVSVEEKVEKLSPIIEKLASEGKRKLKTGWDYEDDRDLWIVGGYHRTEEWESAKKILEDLGYKVSFYDKEYQFVDMYTLIEW